MRTRTALGFGLVGCLGSLIFGGYMGVSGSVRSPRASGGRNVVYMFVDQNGMVSPAVQQGDTIVWGKLDTDGSTYAYVTDVNFRGTPPCGTLAKPANPTNGVCILGASDGWYPYDCKTGGTKDCTDPTLPIGSRTLPPSAGGNAGGLLGEVLRIYFSLAKAFDGFLHFFWSSDDKPLDDPSVRAGASPATAFQDTGGGKGITPRTIDQTPVDGPLIRESVACSGNVITVDPNRAELLHGATTGPIRKDTTIVWDSAGNIGSVWSIANASSGMSLKDVCANTNLPYSPDAVGTAGRCKLTKDLPNAISYQVNGVAGACTATSAPATLGP